MKQLESVLKELIYGSRCNWSRIRVDVGELDVNQFTNTLTGKHKILVEYKGEPKVLYLSGPDKDKLMRSMATIDGAAIVARNKPAVFFDVFKVTIKANDKKYKNLYKNLLTCSCLKDTTQARELLKEAFGADEYTNVNCITRGDGEITVDLIKEVADRPITDTWDVVRNTNPCTSKYIKDPLGNRPKLLQLQARPKYNYGNFKH